MSKSVKDDTATEYISLSAMLKNGVNGSSGVKNAKLLDVVIQLRAGDYPLMVGLLVKSDGDVLLYSADEISLIDARTNLLKASSIGMSLYHRGDDQTLAREEILGRRLIDLPRGILVKAHDVRFASSPDGWRAVGIDVHKHGWLHFGSHESHAARDWHDFMLLPRDKRRVKYLLSANQMRRLKPAQIADIIEKATPHEQSMLLNLVHEDPRLEANVFEELDDDRQSQLLRSRSNDEVAEVLARMRSDDAADAIMELPQERRAAVLSLLPPPQQTKVRTLLGYNQATAGGLMGTDYVALNEHKTIQNALDYIRSAVDVQPEAMVAIHTIRENGTLAGTLSLVRALQLDPETELGAAADPLAVVASPNDDIVALTTRMADFNLLSLPVVDAQGKLIGIVTVDDALEVAIPRAWSRREATRPAQPQGFIIRPS